MSLVSSEVVAENCRINPLQIFVASFNGENNMLVQTTSPEEALEWRASLIEHIKFANSSTEERVSQLFCRKLTPEPPVFKGDERQSRYDKVLLIFIIPCNDICCAVR
jgi:hypothetical protein